MVDLLQVHVQLVHPEGGTLAHSGQLGGLAVGIGQSRHILVLPGEISQQGNDPNQLFPDQFQALAHNDNIGVVSHIAAGGSQMDDSFGFGALEAVSVHMAHDIVTDQLFPGHRILIVDVVQVGSQLVQLLLGNIQALIFLSLGQCQPEPPPGAELVVLREDVLHFLRGIPGGEG